jgi:hypothetical protein
MVTVNDGTVARTSRETTNVEPMEIDEMGVQEVNVSVPGNMGPYIRDETYEAFGQNASKYFEKNFYCNNFGHVCDVCNRLRSKKVLKVTIESSIVYS